jgi:hypothetical protein
LFTSSCFLVLIKKLRLTHCTLNPLLRRSETNYDPGFTFGPRNRPVFQLMLSLGSRYSFSIKRDSCSIQLSRAVSCCYKLLFIVLQFLICMLRAPYCPLIGDSPNESTCRLHLNCSLHPKLQMNFKALQSSRVGVCLSSCL